MADAPEPSNELRRKAAEAGMTPEKFVALSGKTTVGEYQDAAETERKAREGGGEGSGS